MLANLLNGLRTMTLFPLRKEQQGDNNVEVGLPRAAGAFDDTQMVWQSLDVSQRLLLRLV